MRHFRYLIAIATLLVCQPLWAGSPVGITAVDTAFLTSPGLGVPSTNTITLTYAALSSPGGQTAQLDQLMIAGASHFTIIGGTCTANTTVLSPGTPTCTVIVQYQPSSAVGESAQLQLSCNTLGLIGGFSLTCSDPATLGSISLFGSLASLVPARLLDPKLLTLIASMLVAMGARAVAHRT